MADDTQGFSECYERFVVERKSWTFDTFVRVAVMCEQNGHVPAYIGKIMGRHDLVGKYGIELPVQMIIDSIASATYMAISNDKDLLKVRLYCPTFTCLYDYKNTTLVEGNPLEH